MLCDECIMKLGSSLSLESRKIFNAIISNNKNNKKLTRKEIQKKVGLSYSIAYDRINELENKFMISYSEYGRAKAYNLTEEGKRFAKLKQ